MGAKKALNWQKARIHILKDDLNLSRDEYESLLSAFEVSSSVDLTIEQADDLISTLESLVRRNRSEHGWGKNKYEHLRGRTGGFASPEQLRKIEAIWRESARNSSDGALQMFLYRQVKIKNIIWLKKEHVKPVLIALKDIQKKAKTENA